MASEHHYPPEGGTTNIHPRILSRTRALARCRRLALLAGTILVVGCLAGCDRQGQADKANAVRPLRVLNQSEVQTLDPARISWMVDIRAADLLFDGLTQYDPRTLQPIPCMATTWDISDDGKIYTFHLRQDARWSNGDPVTAADFVYSWKRVLEPATAADYVYLLFVIENAQRYSEGLACAAEPADRQATLRAKGQFVEPIPFEQVGIRATDAYTLRVDLVSAAPYFLDLTSFITFKPVHRATIEKFEIHEKIKTIDENGREIVKDGKVLDTDTAWYREPANLVCNGPYVLQEWAQRQYMRFARRADYWNAPATPSERIEILPVDSPGTAFKMYDAGEADIMPFSPPRRLAERLIDLNRKGRRKDVHTTLMFGTYFYRLNTRRKPFDDPLVRRAFSRAIDRDLLTRRLLWMGETPATSLVPPGTRDYVSPHMPAFDPQAARELLAKAGYPDGKGLPAVEIMFNKEAAHQTIAEAVKDMWQQNLGVRVDLQSIDRGSLRKKMQSLDYYASRAGWYGDYNDPITFLDLFTTAPEGGGGNNDTGFSDAEYDGLINRAKVESNPRKRNELLHRAEEILLEQMPIIPLYYYADMYLFDDARVTGFFVNKMGTNPLRFVGTNGRQGDKETGRQGATTKATTSSLATDEDGLTRNAETATATKTRLKPVLRTGLAASADNAAASPLLITHHSSLITQSSIPSPDPAEVAQ